jgi:hypothetical protein
VVWCENLGSNRRGDETCPLASGSRFVRRAEQVVLGEEERGGGDGSETEGRGSCGAVWFVLAGHGVEVSLLPVSWR